jgi:tRNA modification GTPase
LSIFKRNYGDESPIAAQAAQGAVALIRTSGKGSLELLAKIFSRPRALLDAAGNTVLYGWILDETGVRIDEALVSVYRAPRSYTGEDAAEISCHGGSAAAKTILEALRSVGFSDALPGEFTFRSFVNGKIDLTRSESVMEAVSAKTKNALEHAVKRLSGVLEKEINAIRDKLLEITASIELFLDYPEDEIDEAPPSFRKTADEALEKLKSLARSYNRERLYQEGALAVIAGRPNAGKSSLFNALLNDDRSIVTENPGTTRDWIEASLSINGIPLRLADTAGLREFSGEEAEKQGIERSKSLMEEADIILYTVDACIGLNNEDQNFMEKHKKDLLILVWNKIDLNEAKNIPQIEKTGLFFPVAAVSATTGKSLEELCACISGCLTQKTEDNYGKTQKIFSDSVLTLPAAGLGTQRQKELTEKAVSFLEEALLLEEKNESLDLIAPLFRESLNALGEITGEVSSADILEIMFSRFCLGK